MTNITVNIFVGTSYFFSKKKEKEKEKNQLYTDFPPQFFTLGLKSLRLVPQFKKKKKKRSKKTVGYFSNRLKYVFFLLQTENNFRILR